MSYHKLLYCIIYKFNISFFHFTFPNYIGLFEAPHSPGQYGSQISEVNGFHFSSFLGFQGSAADPSLESSQGSGSERQQGVKCVNYLWAEFYRKWCNGENALCSYLECEVERRTDHSRLLQRQLRFDVIPSRIWIPFEVNNIHEQVGNETLKHMLNMW